MIRFKELSVPLKVAVVSAWAYCAVAVISFMVGFIQGLTAI